MSQHVIYAYVDGSDLIDVEADLINRLSAFLNSRSWVCSDVKLVNSKGNPDDPSLGPDDLPDWDLGINIAIPAPGMEPQGWYEDIEATAAFLAEVGAATGREFVVGIGDTATGIAEDVIFIDSSTPDLASLRRILGVE